MSSIRSLIVVLVACALPVVSEAKKKGATLDGTWSSASCGARTYERRITFAGDGTFRSEDRVAPCPPNVPCVWSGIVPRQGTYKLAGNRVKLKPEETAAKQGQPLPADLELKGDTLIEKSGGVTCPYTRFTAP